MTKETLEKLPQVAKNHLEIYNRIIQTKPGYKEEFKFRLMGYLDALKDIDIISEAEKRLLYIYYLDKGENK